MVEEGNRTIRMSWPLPRVTNRIIRDVAARDRNTHANSWKLGGPRVTARSGVEGGCWRGEEEGEGQGTYASGLYCRGCELDNVGGQPRPHRLMWTAKNTNLPNSARVRISVRKYTCTRHFRPSPRRRSPFTTAVSAEPIVDVLDDTAPCLVSLNEPWMPPSRRYLPRSQQSS